MKWMFSPFFWFLKSVENLQNLMVKFILEVWKRVFSTLNFWRKDTIQEESVVGEVTTLPQQMVTASRDSSEKIQDSGIENELKIELRKEHGPTKKKTSRKRVKKKK